MCKLFYNKRNHVISYLGTLDCFYLHKLHSTYCMSLSASCLTITVNTFRNYMCRGMEKSTTKDFQITNENA